MFEAGDRRDAALLGDVEEGALIESLEDVEAVVGAVDRVVGGAQREAAVTRLDVGVDLV